MSKHVPIVESPALPLPPSHGLPTLEAVFRKAHRFELPGDITSGGVYSKDILHRAHKASGSAIALM
ncbi:hypothetical protein PUNSTDRAFT_139338 [Punctularia strigosozonata HHB-11173 SS5]|uniref:Uncharacterized protein n=1 Tax=Punctularia strigosozonata (strain HHB-11173) TaxID=741275 RepID=R7S1F8_PUNST|nr:uncharacterized protein PUNSTDRAFT_139338 [Punctularia strigosozonata HHB-11173 SS5]EIN03617.1 hypothetical protein PUNSTDRAFT_139338 [Punctularia strigosozonata HHB-11173 SS5]